MRTGESSPSNSRPLDGLSTASGFRPQPCPLTPGGGRVAAAAEPQGDEESQALGGCVDVENGFRPSRTVKTRWSRARRVGSPVVATPRSLFTRPLRDGAGPGWGTPNTSCSQSVRSDPQYRTIVTTSGPSSGTGITLPSAVSMPAQ